MPRKTPRKLRQLREQIAKLETLNQQQMEELDQLEAPCSRTPTARKPSRLRSDVGVDTILRLSPAGFVARSCARASSPRTFTSSHLRTMAPSSAKSLKSKIAQPIASNEIKRHAQRASDHRKHRATSSPQGLHSITSSHALGIHLHPGVRDGMGPFARRGPAGSSATRRCHTKLAR